MKALRCVGIILTMFRCVLAARVVFGNADSKGGYTLVTLPRIIVTPYRDSLDGARDRVTYQKLYVFFWVIPRRLNFTCRRFGTLCSIFIGK